MNSWGVGIRAVNRFKFPNRFLTVFFSREPVQKTGYMDGVFGKTWMYLGEEKNVSEVSNSMFLGLNKDLKKLCKCYHWEFCAES